MCSSLSEKTASTGTMTRIVVEISKMIQQQLNGQGQIKFFTSIDPHNNVCFTFIVCTTNSSTKIYNHVSM